ncbi:PREDICTED: uncharacterized protein LOC105135521 isoform X1 [Populus euphratica]|uniref:Uncharacterized protein LOC105135521 isoform X1 n=1 Tax=Populus euphratica TaxID=75702 RepID=A0AAJ6Y159_POPEU|nr:PREDICTED: uncharacterized protein LOC105135521 isoform X1 [Populus euphratica]
MFMDDATQKTRGKGNGVELLLTQRLLLFENREHNPASYEDICTCLLTCSICRVIVKSTSSVTLSLATLPRVNALANFFIITTFRDEQFFVMVAIGHGARATISGHQVNLVIWCRSCIAFLLESCELDLIMLLVVWCSVSVKVGCLPNWLSYIPQ